MLAQILAVSIFVIMFALIISEKFQRHYITLAGAAATLAAAYLGVIVRLNISFIGTTASIPPLP